MFLRPQRYTLVARFYDLLAAEAVYRVGRESAVTDLDLSPGDRVLDIGCGTGLNFPLLRQAVGPGGLVVGVDASAHMLAQARRRSVDRGWDNIVLLRGDATALDVDRVRRELRGGRADAAISTYALSLMARWPLAWRAVYQLTAPGGRMAVVDMQMPTGSGRWMVPLARLACALGGSDPTAEPWSAVERNCLEVTSRALRGGHIQVRSGTRPPD